MITLRRSSALAVFLVVLAAGTAFALTGAEMVQLRRARFGEMTRTLKFAARHWNDAAGYADVAKAGAVIERDAASLPRLFPPGTRAQDGFRTAARDSIWTDRPGFERLARRLAGEAARLAAITPAASREAVRGDIAAMTGTCKACHRSYRAN